MSMSVPAIVRWLPHLAAVLVILLCVRLAFWQSDRAEEKAALLEAWQQSGAIDLFRTDPETPVYTRVRATGRFLGDRTVLLDNQIRGGRAGVHVFSPFRPDGTGRIWLVNRGWHALESRQAPLPRIETPAGSVDISGRLVDPPRVGWQLGEARTLDPGNWPNLVTYLDLDRIEKALGVELADRVILLEPGHPAHLTGDEWRPINFGPERHLAYAWQWLTMALAVFLIWVVLTWRSIRGK